MKIDRIMTKTKQFLGKKTEEQLIRFRTLLPLIQVVPVQNHPVRTPSLFCFLFWVYGKAGLGYLG